MKRLLSIGITLTMCMTFMKSTVACEKQVESHIMKNYLSRDFVNACDGYGDCIDPAELDVETREHYIYKVYVFFGNSGGYPYDTQYVVTTDKSCHVVNVVE